ncbi:MAG: STAS domain-containing protein [Dokdonella sp.]
MSDRLQIHLDDRCMRVSGRINVDNASDALARGREFLSGAQRRVDLSALESADSVTLSVLLAWAAPSSRRGEAVEFAGMPSRLQALAHLSDADQLLRIV